jgi:hypothetical protein
MLSLEALETRQTPSASPASSGVVEVKESFDTSKTGGLPGNWSQWTTQNNFAVGTLHSLSGAHGLTNNGSSSETARAWLNTPLPANAQVSAAVYVSGLIPARVFLRGQDLASNSPTYYALDIRRGLYAQLLRVQDGVATVLGTITSSDYVDNTWITLTLSVSGKYLSAQIYRPGKGLYLNSAGKWQSTATSAITRTDRAITGGGQAGVARATGYSGAVTFDNFSVRYSTSTSTPPPGTGPAGPPVPQHYSFIRIAELAYSGLPIGPIEDKLLRNSVDLVITDVQSLIDHIRGVSPGTPQLAYTNVSSLYLDLLTSWDNYADAHGASRESAFYHVSAATPFSGNSGSSQPVNWFWGVYAGGDTPDYVDLTTLAHSSSRSVPFDESGTSIAIGYPEKFNEINFNLAQGRAGGWSEVLQYPTAVDGEGNPTAWATLPLKSDTSDGLRWSGRVLFDPPANWKTASIGGAARMYYVRAFTVHDGRAPVANTILGADYVHARGGTRGVIPAFDASADANHDGYLSDAEYAHRRRGMDARFAYQSRIFYAYYGQERFATNPSSTAFRNWAVEYEVSYLKSHPGVSGLFVDNSGGNIFFDSTKVREPSATYSTDYGSLLSAIGKAIAPKWILANTSAGSTTTADGVVSQNTGYFEEFALRPLSAGWAQFENLAGTVAHRAALKSPPPVAVLDSLPLGGSPTDPRTQIATLAEYYLLADPKTTFLDPFGGAAPGTTWAQHWFGALTYNVGQPKGEWSLFATGTDPANHALTYRVYQRSYSNALVLYKPLSYATSARSPGSLSGSTATTQKLNGTYRPLRANGTLGAPVTSISLRNGEGAILIKV